jgi:hypothetical protein
MGVRRARVSGRGWNGGRLTAEEARDAGSRRRSASESRRLTRFTGREARSACSPVSLPNPAALSGLASPTRSPGIPSFFYGQTTPTPDSAPLLLRARALCTPNAHERVARTSRRGGEAAGKAVLDASHTPSGVLEVGSERRCRDILYRGAITQSAPREAGESPRPRAAHPVRRRAWLRPSPRRAGGAWRAGAAAPDR